jgi:hypothetical protein
MSSWFACLLAADIKRRAPRGWRSESSSHHASDEVEETPIFKPHTPSSTHRNHPLPSFSYLHSSYNGLDVWKSLDTTIYARFRHPLPTYSLLSQRLMLIERSWGRFAGANLPNFRHASFCEKHIPLPALRHDQSLFIPGRNKKDL